MATAVEWASRTPTRLNVHRLMDGDARESSLSTFMCVCVCGIAAISSLLLLSISQPMKADHPDFARRVHEEMLNCQRWSDIRRTKSFLKKKALKKRQETKQTTWFSRQVTRPWSLMVESIVLQCKISPFILNNTSNLLLLNSFGLRIFVGMPQGP